MNLLPKFFNSARLDFYLQMPLRGYKRATVRASLGSKGTTDFYIKYQIRFEI